MNDVKDLAELGAALEGRADGQGTASDESHLAESKPAEPKLDEHGRAYATGRRKTSVARVWVKPGSGKVTINGKELKDYFGRPVLQMLAIRPLELVQRRTELDVMATSSGGGLSGQAGALSHGLSRALVNFEPSLRAQLKSAGLLTRDARAVERKKYGRAKARRAFQFSKR